MKTTSTLTLLISLLANLAAHSNIRASEPTPKYSFSTSKKGENSQTITLAETYVFLGQDRWECTFSVCWSDGTIEPQTIRFLFEEKRLPGEVVVREATGMLVMLRDDGKYLYGNRSINGQDLDSTDKYKWRKVLGKGNWVQGRP